MDENLLLQFNRIADGLADPGISVTDGFLTSDEVAAVRGHEAFASERKRFHQAAVGKQAGKQINEAIRGDYIQWINPQTAPAPMQPYINRLRALVSFLNQALFLSLKDFEIHLTVYPPGSFYKRHLDQFKQEDHRKLSIICYLNDDWQDSDGGQLRVYFPDTVQDFLPLAGRLICFRSDLLEHEVLPATRERLSITGWMLDVTATGL